MKKLFSILVCLFMITVSAHADLNAGQIKLRNEIKNFLQEEGYVPSIDQDGDITFKYEGKTYYIQIDDSDTSPYYICIFRSHSYSEAYTKEKLLRVVGETNFKKGVKLLCFSKTYQYRAEMYLTSSENFMYVCHKLLDQISALATEVGELM